MAWSATKTKNTRKDVVDTESKQVAAEAPYIPVIPGEQPYVHFWGTRGSIPVSGPRFVRHGGNTSCVAIGVGDECFVIDAGSGIRDLGLRLLSRGPCRIHLFITHTHWDHIQGFPFFAPLFIPGYEVVIYGGPGFGKDLKSIFRGQLDRDYFPVQFEDMCANIDFQILEGESLTLDNFKIEWESTHHPAATLGFKTTWKGRTVGYVSDNEFLPGFQGAPHALNENSEIVAAHSKLIGFLKDVDLLIHEAQYTNEEYVTKIGWGHSSLTNACLLAKLTRAKRWIIPHHDPLHDDMALASKLNLTREILRSLDYPIEVSHAFDELIAYF